MAWNEPGGGKDRDPWGNRGDQDGPPDLDEAFKKLQEKLGGIFGGRKGGGGGAAAGPGKLMVVLTLLVLAAAWWASGLYTVEQGKQGVELRFGKYHETTQPGLQWFARFIDTVEQVDISNVQIEEIGFHTDIARSGSRVIDKEALMLTQDENIVSLQLAVQYRIKDPKAYLFNISEPAATLRQVTESAVREVVGKSKMDFVLTEGRGEIASRTEEMVQQILDEYETGLILVEVAIQDVQPPEQVQHAFADAVKAREDEERLKNKADAYAKKVVPEARGQAARQLEEANAYRAEVIAKAEGETNRFNQILREYRKAPEVTRDRLYLEAVEVVMSSVSKVVVDVDGGNNMFYLPLDRLVGQGATPLVAASGSGEVLSEAMLEQIREAVRSQTDKMIRDRSRSSREGR